MWQNNWICFSTFFYTEKQFIIIFINKVFFFSKHSSRCHGEEYKTLSTRNDSIVNVQVLKMVFVLLDPGNSNQSQSRKSSSRALYWKSEAVILWLLLRAGGDKQWPDQTEAVTQYVWFYIKHIYSSLKSYQQLCTNPGNKCSVPVRQKDNSQVGQKSTNT